MVIPIQTYQIMNHESLSRLLEQLKPQVKNAVGSHPDFERLWQAVIDQYLVWSQEAGENMSGLGHSLALLQDLSHSFGVDLRGDQGISELILAEAPPIGSEIVRTDSTGEAISYEVVDRQITPTFGLLLFLESEGGGSTTEELYD